MVTTSDRSRHGGGDARTARRATIAFALLALLVSVGLATLTYEIARQYLLDQRQELVVRQAGLNARALNAAIGSNQGAISSLLASLPSTSGSHGIVRVHGEWFSSSIPAEGEIVPADIVAETTRGAR